MLLHTKRRLVAKQGGFFVPPLHVILNLVQDHAIGSQLISLFVIPAHAGIHGPDHSKKKLQI
jgi:hypothetical protein